MIIDKNSILQIFGSLMKHPQYLSEKDKYNLTPDDFYYRFDKKIFIAIYSLYEGGAQRIQPIDIENFLSNDASGSILFKNNNGIEYLQDAVALSEVVNFEFYYSHLKKVNLLNRLSDNGIDISKYYIEDLTRPQALEINQKFESLDTEDILEDIKRSILSVEHDFVKNDVTETQSAFEGIDEIIDEAGTGEDIGIPIQGEIFNEVIAGARKGTFVVRSASSGTGKTRQSVGDACQIAYPYRYEDKERCWIKCGTDKKVLFIATEQRIKEIQKMILAYLTGFNESKFRYGNFTDKEKTIIKQAQWLMEKYKDNFYIVQMPNPSISLIKNIVREQVMLHEIEYLFYDYIFICPSVMSEFKGANLRNDEILLVLSTALKDLAVELNIFVMTSTQVNANADNNTNIRNESTIAGSRAVINKADVGAVMARPTSEEIKYLSEQGNEIPNLVTDIYKVRSGEWNQVRIWSYIDLGNLRKRDLYMTDARMQVISSYDRKFTYEFDWEDEKYIDELKELEKIT